MKIFELDTDDRLNQLYENIENVTKLNENFADNVAMYRRFATNVVLPYNILTDCCKSYERNLLIDAYTYSEQLLKNFYYQVLEKDTAENEYLQNFVNNKLKVDRFSPNSNFSDMEQGIRSDLFPQFSFLIPRNLSQVEKYNELVNSRHLYAHRGTYGFDFSTINEVIQVEVYVTIVFEMIVENGIEYRKNYQRRFGKVKNDIDRVVSLYEQEDANPKSIELKEKVRNLEKEDYVLIKNFYKDYREYIGRIKLIEPLIMEIEKLLEIDKNSHKKVRMQFEKINNKLTEYIVKEKKVRTN